MSLSGLFCFVLVFPLDKRFLSRCRPISRLTTHLYFYFWFNHNNHTLPRETVRRHQSTELKKSSRNVQSQVTALVRVPGRVLSSDVYTPLVQERRTIVWCEDLVKSPRIEHLKDFIVVFSINGQ